MDLARVLQALKNADAAGDTTAAKQLAQLAQQMSQAPAPESQLKPDYTTGEMLSKALVRGTKQMGSAFGDIIPAMGANALGFDEYAKKKMGEAAQTQEEINKYYAPQYSSTKDVTGLGSALGFGAETIAEQVPNILTALIPGVGAEAVAARMGAGAAAKTAATHAGAFLGAYAQNAPEIFQNVYEKTGKMDTGAALLFGAGSAALDSILPASLAKRLSGPVKAGIVEKMLEKSGMKSDLLRTMTAGAIKGVPAEGLTEGAQEAISITAENFVANHPQIFGSAEWDRIMQSAIKGAVAGGAFGGVGGAIERGQAAAQRREEYAQALEKRGDRQAAAEVRRQSAEIEAAQAQQPQMQLPGFEMGPATGLMPSAEPTEPTVRTPKSTQAEMFTDEGTLTPTMEKASEKDTKAAANRARQEEQQRAAQVKADEKALKDALAELTNTPKNLAALAQQPSPLAQTIGQARGEMDALAAKRGPKVQLAPPVQEQPETTTGAAPSSEGTITEPTVRKVEPVTLDTAPTTLPTDHSDLKAFGKMFGIGPTARLLKPDGPLAGKDITDPAQAAEVKSVLEAYASGKPAVGAAEKIEAYLKRPEFQGAENVARPVAEPTGTSTPVAVEPSTTEPTGTAEGTERSGMVPAGQSTEYPAGGEGQQPTTLTEEGAQVGTQTPEAIQAETQGQEPAAAEPIGKRAATDLKKAEEGRVEAKKEQNAFIAANDQRVDDILTGRLHEIGKDAGVPPSEIPSESHRGTEAHNMLRLPGLFNEFFRLQDVVAKAQEPNQKAKNVQSLQQVTDAIAQTDPGAVQMLEGLKRMPHTQRDALLSSINKQGMMAFEQAGKQRVAKIKQEIEAGVERPKAEPKPAASEDEIYTALANVFNDSKVGKAFKQLGSKLFSPKFVGPAFDEAQTKLAEQGNVNGLLSNLIQTAKGAEIQKVLRKLRSLNLNAKLEVGPVEDGKVGSYDPATNTITLDPIHGMNAHTIIHEVTHAAISHVLRNQNHPLTKQFTKFFDQVQDRLGAAYGAQDLQEFAAELVGNPEFQAVLKDIKAPRSESMFQNIMRAIAEFFGFQKNAFDAGLKFVNEAIDISHQIEANPADKMFLGTGNVNVLHEVGAAMPKLAGNMVEQAKNTISNLQEYGLAKTAFGLLRLDNLNTLYGKQLPSIQTLLDALELRNGMQERRIKDANTKYKAFEKVQKQYPQQMKRMDNIAIDARLAGVDILDPSFRPEPAQQAAYSKLRNEFSSLPKAVQDVYRTIRSDYDSSLAQYRKILSDAASGVSTSLAKRLAAQFQANRQVVGYVPFLRQGDFWVEYADPATGERTATAFESIRQRQQFIDQMLTPNKIAFKNYQNLQDIRFSGENLPPTSLVYQLMDSLKQQGASQEQIDSVYQSYLTLFPGESIVKQFMKSKNVLGMDRDIIRGYGDTMVRWARKLANSEYIPQIDRAVSGVATEAQNANDSTLTAVAQNILDQSAFFHNPSYNKLVHTATAMSYFEYLAGNVSSALVNMTSLPMMVWPMLSGKYGYAAASTAMLNAGKVATNNWGETAKYKNLYTAMMDHAQLEHTMAREVLEGRRQSTEDFNSVKARIMDGISIPFAASERYNRATTAIAAYDLARQSGMNEDAAVRYALTTVKDVHTSGLAATGPKWMQTPLGRMFFTFKSFVWNSAFVMARAFHQSFKGESPEIRKAAQRQLIGTVGMTAAFAGAKGLPFYGAASVLATMLNSLFGDDDEPYDFNEQMRQFFGELMYKGAFNYATNLELANRAGIATDLIFRDDPRGIAEHGYVLSAMQQAFGPIGTIAVNSGNAFNMFKDGHVERAFETIAPSAFRNLAKGARYMLEGATTLKGDPVMEDIGAYNSLMQLIGFAPADLSSTYEKVSAAKGYEREVNARRTKLLNLYDMAQQAGDMELMQDAKEKISSFNDAIPTKRITSATLQKSIAARKAAEKDMIHGVRFDKKLRPEIQEKFFDEE